MISASKVKELREKTGVGMMDCKKALQDSNGDLDAAMKYLREKGLADAEKKAGRTAKEGRIESYIHLGGKIGVIVEVNCETDFVAKNDEFKEFCHDIAMHIAASNPTYISSDEIPEDVEKEEKEFLKDQAKKEGKPDHVVEKMVEGRYKKRLEELCLLEQPFVKDPDNTVEELLKEKIAKIGEKIVINRFIRFEIGEETS
ncbi:translation elongation factor Ts [Natranaerofaba carboxydovora]|uniref:translation elongation factor Ts n=1 Tax=Natranaerofaba carboxydovora TaxID=2742683 RepID=UPI001F14252D|nr:translation elongation factor Ts [Natranaerofaba carboxydovora]UMZ73394.1 Elongation factor Ts [Natranaerofaba carboxydovora]